MPHVAPYATPKVAAQLHFRYTLRHFPTSAIYEYYMRLAVRCRQLATITHIVRILCNSTPGS